jgi:G:T-mismatch repair DNA endonuclease (very short patch repair protein)
LEDEVAQELSHRGIGFRRQVCVRNPEDGRYIACVDFFLDDGRVVEVNGTFWHADIRIYPDGPVYPAQRRTTSRYDRKLAHLSRLGIEVVELWELDIRENIVDALDCADLHAPR